MGCTSTDVSTEKAYLTAEIARIHAMRENAKKRGGLRFLRVTPKNVSIFTTDDTDFH